MVDSVIFLLSSYPDECLASVLSRYHIVSGAYSSRETMSKLFGVNLFNLSSISIDDFRGLISRVEAGQNISKSLLQQNSLFYLYSPFVARNVRFNDMGVTGDDLYSSRSVAGEGGKIWGCPECLKVDSMDYEVSYFHRSHQIPGVSTCWKHGVELIYKCGKCARPFLMGNEMLKFNISECDCGWTVNELRQDGPICEVSRSFSNFARGFMLEKLEPIPKKALARACIKAMYANGDGSRYQMDDIYDFIVDRFDNDFLLKIFRFGGGPADKVSPRWENFHTWSISKKMLILFCLFSSFESFTSALDVEYSYLNLYELRNRADFSERERFDRDFDGFF